MTIKSHFICSCGYLIYFDVNTKEEFCLNSRCQNYVNERIKNNFVPVDTDLKRLEGKLGLKLLLMSKPPVLQCLFMRREEILESRFKNNTPIDINGFLEIDELLMLIKNKTLRGRKIDKKSINEIIEEYFKLFKDKNFLDDVKNEKVIMTGNDEKLNRTLILKYWGVFKELYNNYGLINLEDINKDVVFKYLKIDNTTPIGTDFKLGMPDLLDFFKKFWREMISINYFFNFYHRTSSNYDYKFDERDIALLLSLFWSMKTEFSVCPSKNFSQHLFINCPDREKHKEFINRFSKEEGKVPIFLTFNNEFWLSKFVIIFYTLHLIHLHSEKETSQEGRGISSLIFENEIRDFLKGKNYIVPFDKEFQLIKNSFFYDIITYSIEKKEVLLIEVKYKDFPPSTISGKTLIDQELKSEKGLINFTKTQKERVEFFKTNLNEFSKKIGIDLIEFKIKGLIVTKYTPLIYENEEIPLYSYDEFLSLPF